MLLSSNKIRMAVMTVSVLLSQACVMNSQATNNGTIDPSAIFSIPQLSLQTAPNVKSATQWSYVSSDACAVTLSRVLYSSDTSPLEGYPGYVLKGSVTRIAIQVLQSSASESQDGYGNYVVTVTTSYLTPMQAWQNSFTVKQHGWEDRNLTQSTTQLNNQTQVSIYIPGNLADAKSRADQIVNWFGTQKTACAGRLGFIDPSTLFTNLSSAIPAAAPRAPAPEDSESITELRADLISILNTYANAVNYPANGVIPAGTDTTTLVDGQELTDFSNAITTVKDTNGNTVPFPVSFDDCTLWIHNLHQDWEHTASTVTQIPLKDAVPPGIQSLDILHASYATIRHLPNALEFGYDSDPGPHTFIEFGTEKELAIPFLTQPHANDFLKKVFYLQRQCSATAAPAP